MLKQLEKMLESLVIFEESNKEKGEILFAFSIRDIVNSKNLVGINLMRIYSHLIENVTHSELQMKIKL